jgi:hypothetical protein
MDESMLFFPAGEVKAFFTNNPFKEWGQLFHNTAPPRRSRTVSVHGGLLILIQGRSRRSDQKVNNE